VRHSPATPPAPGVRTIAGAVAVLLCLGACLSAAGAARAARNGEPTPVQMLGSWRHHDPARPERGREPWTPSDVAGFLAMYPHAYLDTGIRDANPPGNRHWREKGRQVDELQAQLARQGTGGLERICVTERPDVLARLFQDAACEPARGGGGCDWEGAMDGTFGERERVVKHAGVASGGSDDTLEDRSERWDPGAWTHRLLVLRPGAAGEERRRVVRSRPTSLGVDAAWAKPPRRGDRYEIRGSFDPAWVKRVPRAVHEATLSRLWIGLRDGVCGSPSEPRPCGPPAEPLDPFHPGNRRSWPSWFDRAALTALVTPKSVPALYGGVGDPRRAPKGSPTRWTDPYFRVSTVVMDLADPAYREWRIRYLMYKLRDYGITPGEPACIRLAYKPGWYVHHEEAIHGPSDDPCHVPGSGLWTGPAHVCRDGHAPGGPFVAGLYGPGEYQRAVNAYIRELIAGLSAKGWGGPRIVLTERPGFARKYWSILDPDVREHPAVIGEWRGTVEPKRAQLRARRGPEPQAAPANRSRPRP
jgi:hypothetical protein